MASTAFLALSANASIVLYGTRVIYPADQAEVTLKISNEGQRPSLVQAWLDQGDDASQPSAVADVPFVVAPSLTRVEPGAQQTLRILHSGRALATDRESLFWINVLDIPPKGESQAEEESSGSLSLAFRTRIKLMYRPKGLPGKSGEAPEQLQWALGTGDNGQPVLRAHNASAYVVNLGHLSLQVGDKRYQADNVHPALPGQTTSFPFNKPAEGETLPGQFPPGATVVFTSLNDWGAAKDHQAELGP
ncbi:Chaperone protein focC precursor [Delftia tsuruhatensis]|uniref:fimbrial biogenesis chaperone n=1 Tax=Delftia tsuruhatensis TaxID=180282 RepID=UPI001E6F0882|nr:fimbria/pilus periplasmic chaperone [Delftia tsuruhatensis]CAB5715444.1 Chaperone protein focC precursor [Delftia tsuruhatensis]CAC9676726.1 Chaperone protein focC precursor [Delftia tsuruhatensis]